jgi:hypothetical protein
MVAFERYLLPSGIDASLSRQKSTKATYKVAQITAGLKSQNVKPKDCP